MTAVMYPEDLVYSTTICPLIFLQLIPEYIVRTVKLNYVYDIMRYVVQCINQ